MLLARSKIFYEMGTDQRNKYSVEQLQENRDLILCIGYVVEQSLELILKHIGYELTDEYPEKHKLWIITNIVLENLSKSDFHAKKELTRILLYLNENSRTFDNLAYGAKYFPDMQFTIQNLDDLFYQVERLHKWYFKHRDDIRRNRL